MKSQRNNTQIAESAIKLLREGINDNNKKKILASYEEVESSSFNWNNLEVLFDEFDSLVIKANCILYRNS